MFSIKNSLKTELYPHEVITWCNELFAKGIQLLWLCRSRAVLSSQFVLVVDSLKCQKCGASKMLMENKRDTAGIPGRGDLPVAAPCLL